MPSATITDPAGSQSSEGMEKAPQYILERWKQAKLDMEPWHDKIKSYRKMYDLDHYDKPAKPAERRINLTDYTNTVDLCVGIMGANPVVFRAYGFEVGEEAQKQSSRVEKFLAATLYINSMRNQVDIEKAHLKAFVRDGAAVLRVLWDPDYHEEYLQELPPDETGQTRSAFVDLPLRVDVVDPLDFYVVPGGKRRWIATFTHEERTIEDVEQSEGILLPWATGKKREEREKEKHDWLDYWEYATARDLELGEDGEPIQRVDENGQPMQDEQGNPIHKVLRTRSVVRRATIYNDYLIDPLEIVDGYDDLCTQLVFYEPTPSNDPHTWGKCLISSLKELVPSLETRFNRQTRLVDLYASLPPVAKTRGKRALKLDPGVGKIAQLDLEEDLGFPQWPGSPPDVNQQISFLQQKIQETGFPSALYGQGVSQMAGYAIAQLVSTGQIRLTTAVSQLQLGWAAVAKKCLSLLREFAGDSPIHVYGVYQGVRFQDAVTAADATGIRVDAEVQAEFPGEDVQQVALATQATPHLSDWTILERFYKIPQPDDEMKRKLIDEIRKMPAMQEIVVLDYLRDLAAEEEGAIRAATESGETPPRPIYGPLLERYLTQGIPGQAGRPPSGPSAMPPRGLQSNTGEAYPAAEGAAPYGQEGSRGISDLVSAAPSLTGGGLGG